MLAAWCGSCACAGELVPVELHGSFAASTGSFDPSGFTQLHHSVPLWDSRQGDGRLIGTIKLGPIRLGDELALYVAGFPGEKVEVIGWEDAKTGARQILAPRKTPMDHWTLFRWSVPAVWKGREVFLFAEDTARGVNDWLGISAPVSTTARLGPVFAAMGLHLLVFSLLLVPGAALVVVCGPGRNFPPEQALALALAGSATLAYLLFFDYYANARIGYWTAVAILAASVAVIAGSCRRSPALRLPWRELLRPLVFCLAIGMLYSAVLFLYGGIEDAADVAMERYLPFLPPDNVLPFWLTQRLVAGQSLHGFLGDWLSSDRPPLQTGFCLLIHPVVSSALGYQIMGTILQSWVFLGLWILLRLGRLAAARIAWILFFTAFSGFFLFNATFVWPKLLPAAFLLISAALLLLTPTRNGLIIGWCAGLAMLGHGCSAFGLIGIGLVALLKTHPRPWRQWSMIIAAGIITLLPWALYQRFCDPPGNRLLKWHLAGVVPVDARSLQQTLHDAYGSLSASQFLLNKWGNFTRLFGLDDSGLVTDLKSGWSKSWAGDPAAGLSLTGHALRSACFLNLFQSPGPLLLGALGLFHLLRRRPPSGPPEERSLANLLLCLVGAITIVWCLLMFAAKSTVNHQGTYFNNACLFVALGLGVGQLSTWAQKALAALNLAWFGAVWVFAPSRMYFTSALLPAADPAWLGLVTLLSIFSIASLVWLGRPGSLPSVESVDPAAL
ncbi:MAG TPA: hypothetical protein VL200_10965 [Lacunisphaera sp.]|nr:hypothetical protein [Lacunisphaera sp.]